MQHSGSKLVRSCLLPVGSRCESKEMWAVSEEVPECRAGSDYTELIKKEGMSKKGCTLCGNKPSFAKQQSSQNGPDIMGGTEICPKIVLHIRRTIQHKDMEIKWLDFILLFIKLNPVFEHLMPTYLVFGQRECFQGSDFVLGPTVSRMCLYPCCLDDGRKEEDELSPWYSTESLCVTLFGVERKRVATLSHWLLSQWKGNWVSSVPTGCNQKG